MFQTTPGLCHMFGRKSLADVFLEIHELACLSQFSAESKI
jgi:hypothetical protein